MVAGVERTFDDETLVFLAIEWYFLYDLETKSTLRPWQANFDGKASGMTPTEAPLPIEIVIKIRFVEVDEARNFT